ncbi:MAG TPA: alpha-hydroxy-acid oxidizing protein [Chthoniobacterales bacterium]|jgi:L-lactate dehydrogenase (cytochrome)/(S)-mandelate dehydrogenase
MAKVDKAINIEDLCRMAIRWSPSFVSDYVEQGGGNRGGVKRDLEVFCKYQFVPYGLVDVRKVDTGAELFGQKYASVIGVSAMGTTGIYRRDADVHLAQTAAEANVPFILSGAATDSIDAVMGVALAHSWYQLYIARQEKITGRIIARANDAGIKAREQGIGMKAKLVAMLFGLRDCSDGCNGGRFVRARCDDFI